MINTSLPSREIFSIDVPRPQSFVAKFKYNFFVKDEMVTESSMMSDSFDVNSQRFNSRVPRYVKLSFNSSQQSSPSSGETSVTTKRTAHGTERSPELTRTLIRDNLNKIMTQEQFVSYDFTSVDFHDGNIDDRVYQFVSGSYAQRVLENAEQQTSNYRASLALDATSPPSVKPNFLGKAFAQPVRVNGTQFFSDSGELRDDEYFSELKRVNSHVQINSKLLHDIVDRAIKDPHSPHSSDMTTLHDASQTIQQAAQFQFNVAASVEDYKNVVQYVNKATIGTSQPQDINVQIVGYIVDKCEILSDGGIVRRDPMIIENGHASQVIDSSIRYGATYSYTVRSIAQFTLPAIDSNTNDVSMVNVLISSKPTHKEYVTCSEMVAPPPPADLNFVWDYQRDKLLVHWSFPPNSQRDIKKFQVFRRKSTDDPFELMKQYDFDDSIVQVADMEIPDRSLVERLNNPASLWIDDEFLKISTFIYCVASIDAHGLTSNYSAQFKLSFDIFKNRLVKSLVSHAGAPKPYPNLYLETSMFENTIRDAGHSRLTIFFNPDNYHIHDDAYRVIPTIATEDTNGKYKLQFINLDAQKERFIDIVIDDRTTK